MQEGIRFLPKTTVLENTFVEAIMDRNAIFTFETSVKSYETDFQGSWKPACLIQNLIEAASDHASSLGFDYAVLLDRDMVWVLARLKIRFFEIPNLKQAVTIKTWPKGIQQKIFFMRDFDVRSADNRRLAAASFAWLLINPKTRRILPPSALGGSVPDNGGLSSLDEQLEKIDLPDGMPNQLTVNANYSAVDLLGHVNAARYVEWICDCFPQKEFQVNRLDWLQINYIHETKPDETLSIMTGCAKEDKYLWFAQGTNQTTDLKSFEAALGWVKR